VRGARSTACRSFFPNAAIRSWVLRATARKDVLEDRLHPTRARSGLICVARRAPCQPACGWGALFKDRSRQEDILAVALSLQRVGANSA
jgi:hypothetical protein